MNPVVAFNVAASVVAFDEVAFGVAFADTFREPSLGPFADAITDSMVASSEAAA